MTSIRRKKLTRFNVLDKIRAEVATLGSQAAFARKAKVTPAYVSDVLKGRRDPGPKILDCMEMRFVVRTESWYEVLPWRSAVREKKGNP